MKIYLNLIFAFFILGHTLAGFSSSELEEAFNSQVNSESYVDLNGNGKFDLDSEEEESAESESSSQVQSLFFISSSKVFMVSSFRELAFLDVYSGFPLQGHPVEIFYPPKPRPHS